MQPSLSGRWSAALPPALRLLALLLALTPSPAPAALPPAYHRFPALHGNTLVFTSEGDLWRVPATGGLAQRLTSHPRTESRAAISPDGTTIAFTAQYEGVAEVYTMPLAGGPPTRRTFLGASAEVVGWSPDGRILFRTSAFSTLPSPQLATLDPTTGATDVFPLAQASAGTLSPDGPTLFFTRHPKQGSSTKRYRGGWVENLWRYAPRDPEAVPITPDFKGTSRNPMAWNNRIFFVSDRDGIMNLWSIRPDGSDPRQHTRHKDFDVQVASLHDGRIAYQLGADLRLLDLTSGDDRLIPITLASDFDHLRERWVSKPLQYLTSAHLSPKGDRLALTSRG